MAESPVRTPLFRMSLPYAEAIIPLPPGQTDRRAVACLLHSPEIKQVIGRGGGCLEKAHAFSAKSAHRPSEQKVRTRGFAAPEIVQSVATAFERLRSH